MYVAVPVLGGGVLLRGPISPDHASGEFVRETASGNDPVRFAAHHMGAAILKAGSIPLGEAKDIE